MSTTTKTVAPSKAAAPKKAAPKKKKVVKEVVPNVRVDGDSRSVTVSVDGKDGFLDREQAIAFRDALDAAILVVVR